MDGQYARAVPERSTATCSHAQVSANGGAGGGGGGGGIVGDGGGGDGDGGDGDGGGDGGGGGGSRIGGNDRIHHRRRSYYEFVVEPEGFTQATYHRLLEASRRR